MVYTLTALILFRKVMAKLPVYIGFYTFSIPWESNMYASSAGKILCGVEANINVACQVLNYGGKGGGIIKRNPQVSILDSTFS